VASRSSGRLTTRHDFRFFGSLLFKNADDGCWREYISESEELDGDNVARRLLLGGRYFLEPAMITLQAATSTTPTWAAARTSRRRVPHRRAGSPSAARK